MKKDLLICIAFHYVPERIHYLNKILTEFIECYYPKEIIAPLQIIIDTNSKEFLSHYYGHSHISICVHENLEHPFYLTSMHKRHIKDNIDNYENFMYVEDDILIPYENYLNYLENFKLLYPKYVPSFIRIEEKDGIEYVSDVLENIYLDLIAVGDKIFSEILFCQNYHGFWIMPAKELKEVMDDNFTTISENREGNASFVAWGLGKQTLLEIDDKQISKKCYSYHLPNNYALSEGSKYGKIKANEIFI